jgi:hypothetical protein
MNKFFSEYLRGRQVALKALHSKALSQHILVKIKAMLIEKIYKVNEIIGFLSSERIYLLVFIFYLTTVVLLM